MHRSSSRFWIFTGIILFLLFRLTLIFVLPPSYDEMVQNYMAYDIARFTAFPVYFYGQQYMGPLESYFLAPFFRLFGFSYLGARLYYEFFYLSFLGLYVWLIRRWFDRELTVYLFTILSVLPFSVLFFTTMVGYGEILTLVILNLFLLLTISHQSKGVTGFSLLMGIVSGLAFWCNPIFVVWLPSLFLGMLWLLPGAWQKKIPLWYAAGFLLGFFPIWMHGLRTDEWLHIVTPGVVPAKLGDIPSVFYLFFARLKYFLTTFTVDKSSRWAEDLIRYLAMIPIGFFAISFGTFVFSFLKSWRVRSPQERIFFIFVALTPVVLTFLYSSRRLHEDEGTRFFLPLLISYAFSIAWWIRQFRSQFWKHVVLGSLVGIFSLSCFVSLPWVFRQNSELHQVYHFLKEKKLRYGIAEMHLAYALNALDPGGIVATPFLREARYKPVLSLVKEKGPEFAIYEPLHREFREELEADPHLKKSSINVYEIYYGRSEMLRRILEPKSR